GMVVKTDNRNVVGYFLSFVPKSSQQSERDRIGIRNYPGEVVFLQRFERAIQARLKCSAWAIDPLGIYIRERLNRFSKRVRAQAMRQEHARSNSPRMSFRE